MSEQEPDPGFTVVDRRQRGGDEASAAPRQTPPAQPPPPRVEPIAPPRGQPHPDFTSFCVMMYSDALVHLGQVPDPLTGQAHQDLEQAQFTIDLLAMLKEKTEGNRTPEESAVIDEILTTLRMAFVRTSRRG